MSKKKNTLKDLDEFLKQQAATLVSPSRLSDQTEPTSPKEIISENQSGLQSRQDPVSSADILQQLQLLAKKAGSGFRGELCDLIIKTVEAQNQDSPEDRMLINTALYLKSGTQWKEAVRNYWKSRNNGN
jgi:hypothetical protein